MKENKCNLYLVRHGESEANVSGVVQGHFDSPLTKKGEKQAQETAEVLKDIEFGAVYSSDLIRTKRTAEIIKQDKSDVKTSDQLREKSFGEFEGSEHAYFMETLKEEFDRFDNHLNIEERWEHKAHHSMESDREILERFKSELYNISKGYLGENVLVVTHRYVIRMLLVHLGFDNYEDFKGGVLKNGGYAVVVSDSEGFVVDKVVGSEK